MVDRASGSGTDHARLTASPLRLDELDQHPAGEARVQESHPVAPCSRARLGVDELEACTGQAHELGLEIGGAKGEVVETGPVAGEETPHRGIRSEWL